MTKRLIIPVILLLALVGLILYVGGTPWVEFKVLGERPDEIPEGSFAMSQQAAILILSAAVVAIILLWSFGVWLWHLPTRIKTGFGRRRAHSGIAALEQALFANEAGDGATAKRKAKKAHELLARPGLTGLVSAQALEAAGQDADAETQYRTLTENPDTAIAGYRGLIRMAEQKGDYASVKSLVQSAKKSATLPNWALEELFNAEVFLSNWDGALDVLSQLEKKKALPSENIKRRRAVLLAAKASAQDTAGDKKSAEETAIKAAETSSGFAPATALAARFLQQSGHAKQASSLIEKAWRAAPHPALSQAYRDLYIDEPVETAKKKIKSLVKNNPDNRESAILMAEFKLAQGDGVGALQALGPVLRQEDPSARVSLLAASAEDLLDNPVDAGAWRIRAANAPIEADWSDLDPDGPAFDYTEDDWQNLVFSYGDSAALIHPRFGERQKQPVAPMLAAAAKPASTLAPTSKSVVARQSPTNDSAPKDQTSKTAPAPVAKTKTTSAPPAPAKQPSPDNPGVMKGAKNDDLSTRLENLLGNSKKR